MRKWKPGIGLRVPITGTKKSLSPQALIPKPTAAVKMRRASQAGVRSLPCRLQGAFNQERWMTRAVKGRVGDEKWCSPTPNWILGFRRVCYHCWQMWPSCRTELSSKKIPETGHPVLHNVIKDWRLLRKISTAVGLEKCFFPAKAQ